MTEDFTKLPIGFARLNARTVIVCSECCRCGALERGSDGSWRAPLAFSRPAAGKGAGLSSLRNDKGVVINLKSETKGADIKVAASGLKVTLEK